MMGKRSTSRRAISRRGSDETWTVLRVICTRPRTSRATAEMNGREGVVAAVARILPLLKEFRMKSTFIAGNRAMFTYDLVCEAPVGLCRTAEEVTFEDGLVKTIEQFYDPRPFEELKRKAS